MNNITIIGGGTAGWLTALFIQKNYPNSKIKLIESSKIGILGAGEGSTPNLVEFLYELNINEIEFLKRVNGTKKISINFQNWSNINHSYLHGFGAESEEDIRYYAYHFDARLFADYLKEVAVGRGVECIDDIVENIITNDKGYIQKISLEKNGTIITDFVFDCSGFYRITPKLFNLKWKSYAEHLLVNTAVPFFIDRNDKEVNTRTNAIAMDYGWVWQIPLQNRWGCGYIFDSKMISEEHATKEIINKFGHNIKINKTIKFEPGTYEKTWVNNCLIVGLSSGFLEPLEATSIMTTIIQLKRFLKYQKSNLSVEEFNIGMNNIQNQNMLFIRHHYNCSKNDTEFWKLYKEKQLPMEFEKIISKNYVAINDDFQLRKALNVPKSTNLQFPLFSYFIINNGNYPKKTTLI